MISRGPVAGILGTLLSVWLLGCDAEVKKTTLRQPTIVIVPSAATIRARDTLEFHAFVTDTAGPVTWSVEITGGTFLEPNEISPNHFTNLFEAPVTGGVYSVFVSTPTTTATATVTVSPPSCRILSTATSTAPGMDGIWGNDDDSYPYFLLTYSYNGNVASYITYSDPGADLLWRTSDDTVFGYGTIVMTDSVEVSESYVKGADGIVFTADDLKNSIRITDWGPLGKPHPTSIYPYIDPMFDPNGIGPWLSTDMVFRGDDQDFGTSDDFHLLTQNFHDSRGRLLRQESFRGIENQLAKSGYIQFKIDVA